MPYALASGCFQQGERVMHETPHDMAELVSFRGEELYRQRECNRVGGYRDADRLHQRSRAHDDAVLEVCDMIRDGDALGISILRGRAAQPERPAPLPPWFVAMCERYIAELG